MFTLSVEDPCTVEGLLTYTIALNTTTTSAYKIGNDKQYYGLTFDDNISKYFNTSNLCGPLVFDSIVDTNTVLIDPISNLISVLGTDSTSNFEFDVYSTDYAIIK